jgi:predicted permease
MCVGFFAAKLKMIDDNSAKKMTDILFNIVTPCIIISSFQMKATPELMKGLGVAFISALATIFGGMFIARLAFKRKGIPPSASKVMQFATIYSNCGFMGLPLLYAIVGNQGVFYGSIYIAVFNTLTWSHGVALYNGHQSNKNIWKVLLNPGIIGVFIGLALFLFSIKLPNVLYGADGHSGAIYYLGSMNTPLSMLIIGSIIAASDLKKLFTDKLSYFPVLLRNIIIPILAVVGLRLAGVSGPLFLACLIPAACPSAGVTVIFAEKFEGDTALASKTMTISTLFSIISIPAIIALTSVI